MFSPTASGGAPAGQVRNSRRRPRPASSENIPLQPKAKRQRSGLNDHTFVPPDASPEMQEVKARKPSTSTVARRESTKEVPRRELPVRGKKSKSTERTGKGDGSVVLVCIITEREYALLV